MVRGIGKAVLCRCGSGSKGGLDRGVSGSRGCFDRGLFSSKGRGGVEVDKGLVA